MSFQAHACPQAAYNYYTGAGLAHEASSLDGSRKKAEDRNKSQEAVVPTQATYDDHESVTRIDLGAHPLFPVMHPSNGVNPLLPHISSSRVSSISLTFRHSPHSPFSGFLASPAYMHRSWGQRASGSNSSQLASFLCASHRRLHVVHLRKCISHIFFFFASSGFTPCPFPPLR